MLELLSLVRATEKCEDSVFLKAWCFTLFVDVFLSRLVCLCFGVCLFLHSEDFWLFAFHLFSYNLRIADRPQDVLMTVRASRLLSETDSNAMTLRRGLPSLRLRGLGLMPWRVNTESKKRKQFLIESLFLLVSLTKGSGVGSEW